MQLRGAELMPFGVTYLDDTLLGIERKDLILVGAYSGAGKTQLVTNIAKHVSSLGKKVFFLALEAENREIETRMKFNIAVDIFLKDPCRPRVNIDYALWLHGLVPEMTIYNIQAEKIMREKHRTLYTFYKTKDFGLKDFVVEFSEAAAHGADLIVVDHAHYFDWGNQDDNQALKEIVTTARNLNLLQNVPIILVSHLRKKDYKSNLYAPTLEDFHGSSELYKRATKAITLGPGDMTGSGMVDTYINVVKSRTRGEVTRYTGVATFNFKGNFYAKEYRVGKSNQKRDNEFESLERNCVPSWLRNVDHRGGGNYPDVEKKTTVPAYRLRNFAPQGVPRDS